MYYFYKMNEVELIIGFCESNQIKNYTINDDNSIDVDGNVSFFIRYTSKIPIKFNKVTGYFVINYGRDVYLESLENSPREVGGSFNVSNIKLKSLKGAPNFVGGNFYCYNNDISSLEYFPNFVDGNVELFNNPIESLDGYTGNYRRLMVDNKKKLVRKHKLNNLFKNDKR